MRIVIELSGPPRGKNRGRAVSTPNGARVYTDAKTRTYEAQLRYAAQQVMAGRAPLTGALAVFVAARFAVAASWSKKKKEAALAGNIFPTTTPDADNLLKCADALNGVVWVDDKQIIEAHVLKLYHAMPGLTITVYDDPSRLDRRAGQ